MTHTDHRNEMINGLLDLAAFLEANPDVPIGTSGIVLNYFPWQSTDAESFAEIDRIAALLGTQVEPNKAPREHYRTTVNFGLVEYAAVAIPTDAVARHHAEMTYHGCIQP
ncbi:hypothetical protein ACIBG8_28770 [Nonomuraea sp. NPDC050556]|uniref:hypothetical protein n=1 Tax=Nonomuraea sp. NPDC050556 TaxID=3364369 RepID=UPI0037886D14